MIERKLFLQHLKKLSESHYTYAYTMQGTPEKARQFSNNCKEYAKKIISAANTGTPYQKEVLKSIARHVAAENLLLAQDVLSKIDAETKNMIPNLVLGFISRYS
jgi:hypothetical protein